jgi:hypothetical protein
MHEKKKPLGNFNLNTLGRKGLPQGRKQNDSPNHVPLGEKQLSFYGEQFH